MTNREQETISVDETSQTLTDKIIYLIGTEWGMSEAGGGELSDYDLKLLAGEIIDCIIDGIFATIKLKAEIEYGTNYPHQPSDNTVRYIRYVTEWEKA